MKRMVPVSLSLLVLMTLFSCGSATLVLENDDYNDIRGITFGTTVVYSGVLESYSSEIVDCPEPGDYTVTFEVEDYFYTNSTWTNKWVKYKSRSDFTVKEGMILSIENRWLFDDTDYFDLAD